MKSSSFKLQIELPAPPTKVFDALTNARLISQWCGQQGKVDPKVGGKFEMFDGWVTGKVVEFKPWKALAYTWLPGDWPDGAEPSVVKYTFAATKKGTKLSLEHSHFPNETEKKNHKSGWTEYVFNPLKEFFTS